MKVLIDIASDIYLESWISHTNEVADFVKRILPENPNSEILILAGNLNSSWVTIEPFLFELKSIISTFVKRTVKIGTKGSELKV